MPRWDKTAAGLSHPAFYVILIGLPLTGWAAVSTGRAALTSDMTSLVSGVSWPLIPRLPRELHGPMEDVYDLLVKVTYSLVILHVGALLEHQFSGQGATGGADVAIPAPLGGDGFQNSPMLKPMSPVA